MDNSFHSDNSICPINIISRVLSFLASFRSRQIQCPSPLKSVPDLYSAVLCVLQIGRVRANADFKKSTDAVGRVSPKSYKFLNLTTLFKTDCLNS